MLEGGECAEIVEAAKAKGLELSPVAYAGWTEDAAIWSRLLPIGSLPTVNSMLNAHEPTWKVALVGLGIWMGLSVVFWSAASAFATWRTSQLQALRTSTSTALQGATDAEKVLIDKAQRLMKSTWRKFEAPTVIRYEKGQSLAPHFDANRGAEVEDATRGGQTLATLLVYLSDSTQGGETAFGKLGVKVSGGGLTGRQRSSVKRNGWGSGLKRRRRRRKRKKKMRKSKKKRVKE